jgi:hypothetical protein
MGLQEGCNLLSELPDVRHVDTRRIGGTQRNEEMTARLE